MNTDIGKKILLIGMCVALFSPMLMLTVEAQPLIEGMDYSPKNPAPLSTVHFKAGVNGENVNVYVFVEECRDDLCYADVQNISMALTEENRYEVDVTLKHGDANLVHYQIIVESDGVWYKSEMKEFLLLVDEDGEDNGGTPGFDGVFLVIAFIAVLAIAYKRR